MNPLRTPYAQAWLDFLGTKEYKDSYDAMQQKGIKNPYTHNILQAAFAAGWNAKKM
jgi:hypothetical protein